MAVRTSSASSPNSSRRPRVVRHFPSAGSYSNRSGPLVLPEGVGDVREWRGLMLMCHIVLNRPLSGDTVNPSYCLRPYLMGEDHQTWRLGVCLFMTHVPCSPITTFSTPCCGSGI